MILAFQLKSKKIEMTFLLTAEYSDSNTTIQMNPRQAKEYKHQQQRKEKEMKAAEAEKKQDALRDKFCDHIEETIDAEHSRADYIYGKGAKGKMDVKVELLEGKLLIKAVFIPAEGVKPIEGRVDFGITRNVKW